MQVPWVRKCDVVALSRDHRHILSFFVLFLESLLATILKNSGIQSVPSTLLEHNRGLHERSLAIYRRSTQQAFAATALLLSEIPRNENTRNDPAVAEAVKEYDKKRLQYQSGANDIKEVAKSHEKLVAAVETAEPDATTDVRKAAKKSACLWKIALIIGALVVAPLVIVGGILLYVFVSAKR